MESPAFAFFTILGAVFVCSFIILLLLCRYKNIRKNATRYVKKLARSDLRHKEVELIERRAGLVKRFLRHSDSVAVSERCQQLLELCYGLELTNNKLTQPDIQKLHAIIQVAQSITEDSVDWRCLEGREKAGLLEKRTTGLLHQVSMAMAAMEVHLSGLKETGEELKSPCIYQNSLII